MLVGRRKIRALRLFLGTPAKDALYRVVDGLRNDEAAPDQVGIGPIVYMVGS